MKKIEWNVVTWYSKLLALFLFFVVLMLGMYIGSELEKTEHMFVAENMDSRPHISEADIFPLHVHGLPPSQKFNATRYQCEGKEIMPEYLKTDQNRGGDQTASELRLNTGGGSSIILKKINPQATFISYSFSKDCGSIFALVNNQGAKDIFKYDANNGEPERLSNDLYLTPKPGTDVNELFKTMPADPYFIHVINNNELLVSAVIFTTGLDETGNFSIHKIYNVAEKKLGAAIEFIPKSATGAFEPLLLPPTILDYQHNMLSNVVIVDPKELVRKDYDLNTKKIIASTPLDPSLLKTENGNIDFDVKKVGFVCNSWEDTFNQCQETNFRNIFPR